MNSFIKTSSGMAIVIDNKPYNVDNTHPNYEKIVEAVKGKEYDLVPGLVNLSIALTSYCRGRVVVDVNAGVVLYNNQVLHNCLVDRIFDMMREGFDIQPMVLFLENLMMNPSKRAVDELYLFLEYGRLPITEDGCFIAYKRINNDYTDCHSHEVLNKPFELVDDNDVSAFKFKNDGGFGLEYTTSRGVTVTLSNQETIVSMQRNAVDDQRDRTCSHGLHFCSHEYLRSFGGSRTVILKINPADVVSIPSDYNNTKGRACKYVVVGELTEEQKYRAEKENVFTQAVYGADEDYEDMYPDNDSDDSEDCPDNSDVVDHKHSKEFQYGYNVGYRHGHAREAQNVPSYSYTNKEQYDIGEGYALGYKHGKGHTKRLYK